ncbi:MAG: GNAT family N-acetyltransferase [Paracoccaceae bacterium]
MAAWGIRIATPPDAAALGAGLERLSADLGDAHRATAEELAQAMAGPVPPFRAQLAGSGAPPGGVVLYSPVFSTVAGGAGLYVSDLWVAEAARGSGLGRRLLAAAARDARAQWGAGFLTLAVYEDSHRARAFYARLGFRPMTGQTRMILEEAGLKALEGEA